MIKIGIVGLGGMGTVHYMNYKHIDGVEVVAVVGASESDIQKSKEWGLPIFDTISKLCEMHDVDVIDICTPTFLHFTHVEEALINNRNVICEKPLTLKSELARELFELAKEKNKHIYVAHVVQFMKQTEILRDLVENQTYGKPLDAYFERLSARPQWGTGSWMFDKDKAGLIPYDLHIHDLDVIVSLFKTPKEMTYTKSQGILDFPEQYRFSYKYDNLNVVAEAAWFNAQIPFTARWRVYFERGYLVNTGDSLILYPEEGEPIEYDIEERIKIETGINVPATGMYLAELEHFIDCIRKDVDTPYVSQEQIIDVLGVLEKF